MWALPATALSDSQDDGLTVKPTSVEAKILLLKDMGVFITVSPSWLSIIERRDSFIIP